ncbi:FAD dependent oxidoreductase [Aspergillus sclerotialis]|uniref:sarcosine oxidasee (formaldehyde-forming) n=1 Tax=Aspergillus sclerotialis TaxID=2070753 RepID=A0A3A2ZGW0_9EURO|nr:FAD dependent oxidoreductase [Aspergillus sclerotialis]
MDQYDVAVIGLGVLGSAAAYYSALKSKKVIAFEQFELGHVHGSSHDTSRIVRTSNPIPEYVRLAKSAYKDWAELEKAAGQKLLTITGGVVFLPKDENSQFRDLAQTLDAENVPYELLNADEANKRWPQFNLPNNVETVYTPDTGIAHASKTVATMQFLARSKGAVIHENTRVDNVTPKSPGQGVAIETTRTGFGSDSLKRTFQASKVILTTDAWTNKLLAPLGVHIPLSIMQEQVTYFKPTDKKQDWFNPDKFPVWIWAGDKSFYGFPTYGEPTIKAGRDTSNNFMTPEQRTYVQSPELLEQLSSFMARTFPDEGRQKLRTVTCQYTITPDRQFIISPLKDHPDVILGLGAAHAFKFAPAFGRVLAELAIDGETAEDISKFGIPKVATSESKL